MLARPISLILAAGLLILIGLSGMAAGGGLLSTIANGSSTTADVRAAALAFGTTMAVYGFAAVLAGVGLLIFRRWAWRLGLLLSVVGLVLLTGAQLAAGPDLILGFGVAVWVTTFVCLVAPDTRRAVAGPPSS
ncbi:MAG TPA: hypothetical protein VHM48_14110 [Candidatus Limnocylindrales bacterium]|nr:hypothetical protein [Candidatus Limnocylindrales bacterium]